jgi:hypothetical protein
MFVDGHLEAKSAIDKTTIEITPITCGGPKLAEWKKKPVMLVAAVAMRKTVFQRPRRLVAIISPSVTTPATMPRG